MKKFYLAGGCFWCISDFFLMQDGVEDTRVGYSGGDEKNVTYDDVKAQKTGHRESVEVIYDENVISLDKLVDIYFQYVDVLDGDGQGIDRGRSYSLALYYQSDEEKELFLKKALKVQSDIGTCAHVTIAPFKFFIEADEEHQHFSFKNPKRFEEELLASNHIDHLNQKKK